MEVEFERAKVTDVASMSRQLIILSRAEMDRFVRNSYTERHQLARSLLASSLDHAHAICHLLAQSEPGLEHSALALFRIQSETFLRGAFFAAESASSDDEVEHFLKNDELPARMGSDGRRRRVTYNDLKKSMQRHIALIFRAVGHPDVDGIVDFSSRLLNSPVHGGNVTVELYDDREGAYTFLPDADWLLMVAGQSGVMGLFAFFFDAVYLCGLTDIRTSPEWASAYRTFMSEAERYQGEAATET